MASAILMLAAVSLLAVSAGAQITYKSLYAFDAGGGGYPQAGLTLDKSGNLYGTTLMGGPWGAGTVFKLTPNWDGSWTETELPGLWQGPDSVFDGTGPAAGVIFDPAGNLYGTTLALGSDGAGNVFKLTRNSDGSWTESVLHSFRGPDGATPSASLVFDASGNLYGTTSAGGGTTDAGVSCGIFGTTVYGNGTVFKLTPNSDGSWTESVLHSFTGGSDGSRPCAGLIFDASGNLYGTTALGGTRSGTVFKLTPNSDGSWTESVLHSFTGGADGANPQAGLVLDAAGNVYGTAAAGGGSGVGTVFKLTPNSDGSWSESVLHSFTGGADGADPRAALTFDTVGNLYGTTRTGGLPVPGSLCGIRGGCGTVYKLTRSSAGGWTESVLHDFTSDNSWPMATLVFDKAGNLYGTTFADNFGYGGVFEISGATLAPTYFMITSSSNPDLLHQPVTFTTTSVPHDKSLGYVTGTVTFKDGATTLGSAPISGSHASITTSSLGIGTHNIVAYYSGSKLFAPNAANVHEVITEVALSAAKLNFGNQTVGTISPPQSVTITNVGSTALSIGKLFVTGNFRIQASTCGTTLSAGAPCTVTIVFQPAGTSNRYGNLWIYDNGGASPQKVALAGFGE